MIDLSEFAINERKRSAAPCGLRLTVIVRRLIGHGQCIALFVSDGLCIDRVIAAEGLKFG